MSADIDELVPSQKSTDAEKLASDSSPSKKKRFIVAFVIVLAIILVLSIMILLCVFFPFLSNCVIFVIFGIIVPVAVLCCIVVFRSTTRMILFGVLGIILVFEFYLWSAGGVRLFYLFKGEIYESKILENLESFDNITLDHPEWGLGVSYVSPRDNILYNNTDCHGIFVYRVQREGTCTPTAIIVWKNYLEKLINNDAPMIDMMDVEKSLPFVRLFKYIFIDEGGIPDYYNKLILDNKGIGVESVFGSIGDALRDDGPLLVINYDDGCDDNYFDFSHDKFPVRKEECDDHYHALVLIGHRIAAGGKSFYLMQNWNEDQQFFEVSEDYLGLTQSLILHTKTPQTPTKKYKTSHRRKVLATGVNGPPFGRMKYRG